MEDSNLDHLLLAYVDMKNWVINFKYPPNFLELFKNLQEKHKLYELYEPRNLKGPMYKEINQKNLTNIYSFQHELYNFLAGISYHEFGHSKECPIDTNHFAIIVQAVSTALEKKKVFDNKLLFYIVNLFTDIIVNTLYGLNVDNGFFRNSIFTFYFSELLLFDSSDISFYFFILINLKLFQFHGPIRQALENILFPKLPQNNYEILEKLIQIFCPFKKLLHNLIIGVNPTENERWKIINFIIKRDNWGKMAYDFTEIIFDYISKNQLEVHQPVPDSVFIKEFKQNSQFQKEVLDKIIERKFKLKRGKKKSIKKKTNGKSSQISIENYPGESNFDYGFKTFNNVEKNDGIYRYHLKTLKVYMPETEKVDKFTLTWLNREIMTEKDNIMNFDPFKVFFLPNSEELLLFKKSVPLTDESVGSIKAKGFPNLIIFCDDSGSMTWKPITGTGKYDALIITILSLFKWLESKPFAPVIKYNLTFFSTTTRSTGWIDYYHLDDVKPLLFLHEGGGTKLNPSKLNKILDEPHKKAIILITDGEISNSDEIFQILNKYKNDLIFLFIQIGSLSRLGQRLKNKGFNVTEIKNIKKLSQIVLTFIKNTYQSFE